MSTALAPRTQRLVLPALLAALGASGCRFVGATVSNLDALHPQDGRHAYVAVHETHLGWASRFATASLLRSIGRDTLQPRPGPVEDPVETCVEALNELRKFDSGDFAVASTQVEYFARAAVFDPWCLSREIALRELARAGKRLELGTRPVDLRAPTTASEEARVALEGLVANARAAFEQPGEGTRAEFIRACEGLAALPLELSDGLRVLHGVNVLLRAASRGDARIEPLRPLALALQRRVATQAVELALVDAPPVADGGSDPGWPSGRVQAAAVRSAVALWGEPKLAQILARNPFGSLSGERLAATLECVAALGLPALEGERGAAQRAQWAEAIYLTAVEHPEGRVRIAAMKALGKLSGRGLDSLQELDWQEWWLSEGRVAFGGRAGQP